MGSVSTKVVQSTPPTTHGVPEYLESGMTKLNIYSYALIAPRHLSEENSGEYFHTLHVDTEDRYRYFVVA